MKLTLHKHEGPLGFTWVLCRADTPTVHLVIHEENEKQLNLLAYLGLARHVLGRPTVLVEGEYEL